MLIIFSDTFLSSLFTHLLHTIADAHRHCLMQLLAHPHRINGSTTTSPHRPQRTARCLRVFASSDAKNTSRTTPLQVPTSAEATVEQATATVLRAYNEGILRQRIQFLLPLIGATELDDWYVWTLQWNVCSLSVHTHTLETHTHSGDTHTLWRHTHTLYTQARWYPSAIQSSSPHGRTNAQNTQTGILPHWPHCL